jgi:2-polyprenyl-6-methoxyphenol hydroxylase-like FAD-dependent oxidoreductase
MAMVDALELAEAIARSPRDGVRAALASYEAAMLPRNRAAVARSRAAAQAINARGRFRVLGRNARLRLGERLARS